MEWFRWYHGTVSDPKFSVIAKRSQQPRHVVIACWPAILEHASTRSDRGSLEGIDCEEIAVVLDLETEQVVAVYQAMKDKGMVVEERLVNWEKRQPKREDATGAVRKERWKKKQKEEGERTGTQENAEQRTERARTEQSRAEQNREEKSQHVASEELPPPEPSSSAGGLAGESVGQVAIRKAVAEKTAFIRKHFPLADIELETERMVSKARDNPVTDPVQFVLAWFPRAKPARAVMSADQVEEHNRRAEEEFLQGVSDG